MFSCGLAASEQSPKSPRYTPQPEQLWVSHDSLITNVLHSSANGNLTYRWICSTLWIMSLKGTVYGGKSRWNYYYFNIVFFHIINHVCNAIHISGSVLMSMLCSPATGFGITSLEKLFFKTFFKGLLWRSAVQSVSHFSTQFYTPVCLNEWVVNVFPSGTVL